MPTPERLLIEHMLLITNKEKQDVPFRLNYGQAKIDDSLTGHDIVPKSRQQGVSSYFLARYLMKCISEKNTRAVVISHDTESTQRMLARVRFFIRNMRGPEPVLKDDSKNEITFPKMNSAFYIGTAGSRRFGRGDTITHLHCSEVAYWPDPKNLIAGLFQAVPKQSGEIAIESTGNGTGNWYHRACLRAAEGTSRYKLHFLSWLDDPDCYVPINALEAEEIMNDLRVDLDEIELTRRYPNITAGQLLFRRQTLEEMDYDLQLFCQEYPATLDECFQATGSSVFSKVNYAPTPVWEKIDSSLHALTDMYKSPRGKHVIGADVGGGLGKDRSVAEILSLDGKEQIAEWASDKYDPEEFAKVLADLGRHFNMAYISVESNNHGAVTLLKLRDLYPRHLIYSHRTDSDHLLHMGYRTTTKTRPIMIGRLRSELVKNIKIHSPLLKGELDNFVEADNGKLQAAEGCFDDRVIALAVANMAYETACMLLDPYGSQIVQQDGAVDPFSLEGMIASVKGRKPDHDFPIPRQDIDSGNSNIH